MIVKLPNQTPKFNYLLFLLFILFSLKLSAKTDCGSIEGFEFTNGHESVTISNGDLYVLDQLPGHFYINTHISGASESVKYIVENLDTGQKQTIIENLLPYTFPAGNDDWNLGKGKFKVTAILYKFDLGFWKCESKMITFTIGDEGCDADAGTLDAYMSMVTLEKGTATISATASGSVHVPSGYINAYVLTKGDDLIIQALGETPSFEVTESGMYTIHSIVFDPNTLDTSGVGGLSGIVVNSLLIQGGGDICASLDVSGAPIMVEEDVTVCNAFSGSLYSKNPINCLTNGSTVIYAKTKDNPVIPQGYQQLYVLTEAFSLTILNVSSTPEFEVNSSGFYRIHSLVYNPNTLGLSIVSPGQTTGFDVVKLITDNGICASLDVEGAINLVIGSRWFCYFFNKYFNNGKSGKSVNRKNESGNAGLASFVNNYDSYEAFKEDFIDTYAKVKFFPNPVVNNLKVDIEVFDNEVMDYNIIDVSGRRVISGSAKDLENGMQTINTSRLNAGMYLVQFTSEYRTITEKIIVKK